MTQTLTIEKKSTRAGFGEALLELGERNPDVVALCADLTGSLKMDAFANAFPDRFFQAGIAEANMMGMAAGLTIGGKIPFTGTFANFSTGRVYDQIRQSIAYSGKNVKICASHAGLTLGEDGASHQILEDIGARGLSTGEKGKGQSVWVALGYLFARDESDVIALHDCDIVTYNRILLGRLIEPIANPNNQFQFCKGYYARISPTDKAMKGRATRLFVTPFVDAMANIMCQRGHMELERFFNYHRTYKYPLAGEFCFTSDLARGLNIAYDWGLEVATLSQVYDQLIPRQIAQIDLAPNYEHKHQEMSADDTSKGLHRMAVDIAKFYLTYMRSHGVPLDDAFVDMMLHTYYQNALKYIRKYAFDADVNDLRYDLYEEESSASHFRGFLWDAWMQSKGPQEAKLIPSWNRVAYSFPDIYEHLMDSVEADNTE